MHAARDATIPLNLQANELQCRAGTVLLLLARISTVACPYFLGGLLQCTIPPPGNDDFLGEASTEPLEAVACSAAATQNCSAMLDACVAAHDASPCVCRAKYSRCVAAVGCSDGVRRAAVDACVDAGCTAAECA